MTVGNDRDRLARENAALKEKIAALEEQLRWLSADPHDGQVAEYCEAFGTRATSARVLVLLMRNRRVTKERLYTALYADRPESETPTTAVVSQHVRRAAALLERAGLNVRLHNIYNAGWSISDDDKKVIQDFVNG